MITFQGFKPSGLEKIANAMGFQGEEKDFQKFLEENPDRQAEMMRYQDIARKMVEGGYVKKMSTGGGVDDRIQPDSSLLKNAVIETEPKEPKKPKTITDVAAKRVTDPKLPTGAVINPFGIPTSDDQIISTDSGQLEGNIVTGGQGATTTTATATPKTDASTYDADKKSDEVKATVESLEAAQTDPNDPRAKVTAQESTKTLVENLDAAQGTGIIIDSPARRDLDRKEIVDPVANAEKASKFTEEVQAATATPSEKATVAGQLATLTADFDAKNPPPWASGALRGVMAQMQARGMGASSIAGQAMVQAALESALPIASADAKTQASFEAQNLSNRQARAMLAAQQRAEFMGMEFDQAFQAKVMNAAKVSDIANMNFNAEQQVILENSKIVNTMELANLNNRQALVLAEASALANLDMANLNNRQQAQVMNAQNFLQLDMANLSNKQQTELFKTQQMTTALFNDQAAENASQQFNATSQNQVDQFFAQLQTQTSQFNAAQANAHAQFNAGEANALAKFNSEMQNQRDQFNAKNRLIIDQNNAQWRRQIATADTTAVNRANELNATALLNMSNSAYNNLWTYYNDVMEMSWESTENERQRVVNMAIAQLNADTQKELSELKADYDSSVGFGSLVGTFLTAGKDSVVGNLLGF
tara:strand:- start:3665 stop:5614 length:1950 start_codon:yes stop_codon:yes gene_type:complete